MTVGAAIANADAASELAGDTAGRRFPPALIVILLAGLLVRAMLVWWFWNEPLMIADEKDYHELAVNLVETGRYAFGPGELTSLRPPLYPALVAGIYQVFGVDNYPAVRIVQVGLALITVVLVYAVGRRMYDEKVALWAAALCCFYPELLGHNAFVLTETLFAMFLCLGCWMMQRFLASHRAVWIIGLGCVLGLAALTRSVLWLFPPFLLLFLLYAVRGVTWPRRFAYAVLPLVAFALTITPWSIRNTRLHKTFTTIDVMGGRNFMMGNYEYTPMFRAWDAISISGEQAWYSVLAAEDPNFNRLTQGQKDKAAMHRTIQYVLDNPGLTTQRDLVKFLNFWQLERSIAAGLSRGWWGDIPTWAILLTTLIIFGSYAILLLSGVMAFTAAPPTDRRMHWFMLLLVGFVCAIHTVVFGHSRYHLVLMPLILIYAGRFFADPRSIWSRRGSISFWIGALVCGVLLGGWIWEIGFIELERVRTQVLQ